MDDKDIVEGLTLKKEEAVRFFVESYQDLIFKTCLAYTQNEEDAADLTQEVFIKVLNAVKKFKFNSKLSTWVVRIAINQSVNYNRSRFKSLRSDSWDKVFKNKADDAVSVVEQLDNRKIAMALKSAIKRLPENQSKVFVLQKYHDYSYKEIAEITNLSESAIDSLLSRAKQNLKKTLSEFYRENFK